MSDKPFCIWPWFHQTVKTNGNVTPCVVWNEDIDSVNYENFITSQFMQSLRDSFRQGIPHEKCKRCVYLDKFSDLSVRRWGFNVADSIGIGEFEALDATSNLIVQSQDVNLSNVCNLKCRTCNQTRSTKWMSDAVAMGEKPVGLLRSNWSLTTEQAIKIKRLRFPGGEPLLHQDIICNELNKIKKFGTISEFVLHLTTNMTIPFSNELVELMKDTKQTFISCSVDGVGKINNYIRSDSKWETIESNIFALEKICVENNNIIFDISTVYSVFNSNSLDELINWTHRNNFKHGLIILDRPTIHDARNLPVDYKNLLIDRYKDTLKKFPNHIQLIESVITHLSNSPIIDISSWKEQFKKHNDFLDYRRNSKLEDVNLELSFIVNN